MRKLIIFLPCVVLIASCRKERNCVCRTPHGELYQVHQKKMTKKKAEEWCKEWNDQSFGIYPCKIE